VGGMPFELLRRGYLFPPRRHSEDGHVCLDADLRSDHHKPVDNLLATGVLASRQWWQPRIHNIPVSEKQAGLAHPSRVANGRIHLAGKENSGGGSDRGASPEGRPGGGNRHLPQGTKLATHLVAFTLGLALLNEFSDRRARVPLARGFHSPWRCARKRSRHLQGFYLFAILYGRVSW
jgi:hypothetical protein